MLFAELASISIENSDESIFISLVPITVLVLIQLFLSYITLRNKKFRQVIDGKPTIIIKNGKLVFSEMAKLRYSLDDLILQLREQGVTSIEDVKFAILENNGSLSVFDKKSEYPLPIILDGKVDYKALNDIKKSEAWLNKLLVHEKIDLSQIFYAFYAKGNTFIIKRNDLI